MRVPVPVGGYGGAVGNFYEGFIATGVTSSATDDAIQANIIAVGYKSL